MALIFSSSGPDCVCDVVCDVCDCNDCELQEVEEALGLLAVEEPLGLLAVGEPLFLSSFPDVLSCWQLLATVCDRSQSPSIFLDKNSLQNSFKTFFYDKWPTLLALSLRTHSLNSAAVTPFPTQTINTLTAYHLLSNSYVLIQ